MSLSNLSNNKLEFAIHPSNLSLDNPQVAKGQQLSYTFVKKGYYIADTTTDDPVQILEEDDGYSGLNNLKLKIYLKWYFEEDAVDNTYWFLKFTYDDNQITADTYFSTYHANDAEGIQCQYLEQNTQAGYGTCECYVDMFPSIDTVTPAGTTLATVGTTYMSVSGLSSDFGYFYDDAAELNLTGIYIYPNVDPGVQWNIEYTIFSLGH